MLKNPRIKRKILLIINQRHRLHFEKVSQMNMGQVEKPIP